MEKDKNLRLQIEEVRSPGELLYPGPRGFLLPWRHEKREKEVARENLWLPATDDWSYRANRFKLGSRSDPASWLEETYKRILIGLC